MTVHPVPEHGTEARYQGSTNRPGCHCRRCTTGWTRAGQLRQLARLEGRPATIPAKPITEHIAALHAAGMSTYDIATSAMVNTSTVVSHAAGNHTLIRSSTATKLLAVQPGAQKWRTSAVGTRRRLQALYAIGHGSTTIAARSGVTATGIDKILNSRVEAVSVNTRDAIAKAYRQLIHNPGTSVRARNRARRNSWPGPLAWDDIDDPEEQPEPETVGSTKPSKRDDETANEIAHLASFGIADHEIAARLNRSVNYVHAVVAGHRSPGWRQQLKETA